MILFYNNKNGSASPFKTGLLVTNPNMDNLKQKQQPKDVIPFFDLCVRGLIFSFIREDK